MPAVRAYSVLGDNAHCVGVACSGKEAVYSTLWFIAGVHAGSFTLVSFLLYIMFGA